MATVHLGRALGAGGFERLVAIKTMHAHLADESEFVAMFLDEARLAAQIRHPNVVGTIDVQNDGSGVFLVMEYIEGPSLQQVLRALQTKGETLPLDIALRIFLDALAGLHAAHELLDAHGKPLNLVHRDVSPQNILIGVDGVARITDFGVARAEARISSTQGAQIKGKIAYMSPEQASRGPVDRQTDVYAAGVILWELLALKRLVKADSELELLALVVMCTHPSPRTVNPAVPEPLDAVCMRALKKDVTERYATTADFAEALDDAAREAGIKVASSRVLATFVRSLGAHAAPVDLPPPSSAAVGLLDDAVSTRVHSQPQLPSHESAPPEERAMTSASAILVSPSGARPDRALRPTRVAASLLALVIIGGLGWLALSGRGQGRLIVPAAQTSPSSYPPATSATVASLVTAPVAPPANSIEVSPASSASASVASTSSSSSALPREAASSALKGAAPLASSKKTVSGTEKPTGGGMYRPPEL